MSETSTSGCQRWNMSGPRPPRWRCGHRRRRPSGSLRRERAHPGRRRRRARAGRRVGRSEVGRSTGGTRCRRWRSRLDRSGRPRGRQRDDERRALPSSGAVGGDSAAVQLDEMLDERQPSPRPPCARVLELSAWRNRSNTCGSTSGAIPWPVSLTTICTWAVTRCSASWTWPPAGRELDGVDEQVPDDLLKPALDRR